MSGLVRIGSPRAFAPGVQVSSATIASNVTVATAAHERASEDSFQTLLASVASQSGVQGSAQSSVLRGVQVGARRGGQSGSESRSAVQQKQATAEDGADKSSPLVRLAPQPSGVGSTSGVLDAGNGAAGTERAGDPELVTDAADPSAIISLQNQSASAGLEQRMLDSFVGDESPAEAAPIKGAAQGEGSADPLAAQKHQKRSNGPDVASGVAAAVVLPAALQPPAVGDVAAFGALGLRSQVHAAVNGGADAVGGSSSVAAKGRYINSRAGKPEESQGDIRELGLNVAAPLGQAIGADGSESGAQPGISASGITQGDQVAFAAAVPLPMADGTPESVNSQEINKPELKTNASGDLGSANKASVPTGSPSSTAAPGGSPAAQGSGGGSPQSPSAGATPASGSASGPAPGAIAVGLAQASAQATITHLTAHNSFGSSSPGNGPTDTARGARAEDLRASAHAVAEESAASSGVNAARVIQAVGQSEMHVEMRSEEFGDISIRTSISNEQMQAQISVDHSVLSQTLSTHVPMLQARLGEQYGLHASIEIDHPGAGLRGDSGGSSQHQQGTEGRSSRARTTVSVGATESGSLAAITGGAVSSEMDRSGGLDITV